jgi:hypothetical protein
MILLTLLFNCILVITDCRRRYGGRGGSGAGVGKVTKAFGNGVATLLKDIKSGNFGE